MVILLCSWTKHSTIHTTQEHKLVPKQGLNKLPSSHLGQVDFPTGQVIFHSHLPNEQGPRQVINQLKKKVLALGKQMLRAACLKMQTGNQVFFISSPIKNRLPWTT